MAANKGAPDRSGLPLALGALRRCAVDRVACGPSSTPKTGHQLGSATHAGLRNIYCMLLMFPPWTFRISQATRVCAQTLQRRVKPIQSQRPDPRQKLLYPARGIHVKAGAAGAARGVEVDEVDEVVRIRERIWDVRSGGNAVPLPPFLLTTN